jgi:hypothetical protein
MRFRITTRRMDRQARGPRLTKKSHQNSPDSSFRMKQSGQSRSLAASETRSNAKKRRTDSRVAKIDVESKKNSARWGRGKGGGNKPIVGFSFSKKKN